MKHFATATLSIASLTALLLAPIVATQAAEQKQKQRELPKPDQIVEYKKVGDAALHLHVFNPPGHKTSDKTPAIVFFFGGGWAVGTPTQFYKQSAYLASRGMVGIAAEYRTVKNRFTKKSTGTTVFPVK